MNNTENIIIEVENNVVRIIEDIPQPPKPDPRITEKTLDELYAEKASLISQKSALIGECNNRKAKLDTELSENVAYIDKQLEVTQKAIDDGISQGATINS